ncbi:unnamed protein product [Onchocerca flexuosa]|uniref:Uncharacterized protein n=1 Tax=Onchocerca flexuosa TaxID=387005 RepID=A0A183I0D8_9BILA|nr:unnamed protein product [Onchocerca flexuosa]
MPARRSLRWGAKRIRGEEGMHVYQSIFASECGFIPSLIRQEDQRYHNFSHNNNDDDDDEVYENWTFTGNH